MKYRNKISICILCLVVIALATGNKIMAQGVAINEDQTEPDASAILDVKSSDKGLLIPRINILNLSDAAPVTSPAISLLVYNTNSSTGEGYYYWTGSEWMRLTIAGDLSTDGLITCGTENYIIKSDGTNGVCSQIFDDETNVGIGTASPDKKLDVDGGMRIRGNEIYGSSGYTGNFGIISDGSIALELDDNSDGSGTFKIKNGSNTIVFEITEGGTFTADGNGNIDGDLTLTGSSTRNIFGPSDSHLDIKSETGLDLYIDSDNNGTGSAFYVKTDNIGDVNLFRVDEDGDATVYRKFLLTPLGAQPAGVEGEFYSDNAANIPYYHDGTAWRPLATQNWVNANDDNTSYSAGNQLILTGTTFDVDEGSGSGLDADVLDGQDGSYYLDGEWTDAGDYLSPADDAGELTKIYETASPTSRVRGYSRVTSGNYAYGDLGYYGSDIGATSRHIGVYGNSGVGSGDNVAVAGRYSAGRIGYIAGERYAIYGKFDENATGLTSSYGGYFINDNDENNPTYSKYGVYGDVTAANGTKYAIYGSAESAGTNYGVYGKAFNGTTDYGGYFNGTNYGAYGKADADNNSYGLYGVASQTSTSADYTNVGVYGKASGGNASYGDAVGVLGFGDQANSWYAIGVYAGLSVPDIGNINTSDVALYVDANSLGDAAYFMNGNVGIGTKVTSPGRLSIIHSDYTTGIWISNPGHGIEVSGMGVGYDAIRAEGKRYGVYASGDSYAGYFVGDVNVTGNLTKGSGSFLIDHPLDPENKDLYHSFVESPDMLNVYNGNVTLDDNGEAVVSLPDYFEALNIEYRYQLTAIGQPGPSLYIKEEVKDNKFKIAGGKKGMKVSWQVTGIRNDPYARENRIVPEVKKENPGELRYPESYKK